jgi:NodT family efflux transporter outer membrane factor (OMF) lipoprotein
MRRAALLALLLAGCAAPATRQVVAPVAPNALKLSGPAAPVAPDWWRGFGDPQLDRLVAVATDGNPTLDAALARVTQAEAVLAARRADAGPNATVDAQAQVTRLSGRYTIPPPFAGTVRFVGTGLANLGWNLDLFGRQRSAIRGARASAAAAALDLEAARLALSGSVVATYLDLARAEAQAAIAQRTITAREGNLRLIDVRIRNRLASKLDREGAATLLAQARQALVRAEANGVLARNALAALAGQGPDVLALTPTALRLDAGLPMPVAVPADLLGRRADIVAAEARITAAAQGKEGARRAYYPNVNLSALAGLQAIGIGNLFDPDAGTLGAGPALSLPLFDNGRRRAELEGATAALDLATADYNDRVIGAVREAADGIAQVRALEADRLRQREVLAGYRETGRLNGVRVRSGLSSRLDLVDNDIRTLDAEQADANLAVDAAQARVRLAVALGGGFDPQGTRP